MNDNTVPRLSVGAGPADGSRMCAMQVISWENGDATITDLPECADRMLSKIVQRVNDTHCTHRDGDLLCAPCSDEVLALAHRTAGTALTGWTSQARGDLYAKIAREQADSVAHLRNSVSAAAFYASDAAASATNAAADAAFYASDAAANASDATFYAADAVFYASDDLANTRLTRAHAVLDRFIELTGITTTPVAPEVTEAAVLAMSAVTT